MRNGGHRQWRLAAVDEAQLDTLVRGGGVSPLFARLLARRGVSAASLDLYLRPTLDKLANPFLLPDMEKAVERVLAALRQQDRILIHGDYDVDGISSTALLVRFFRELRYPVETYIPNRLEEGHGINPGVIASSRRSGVRLLITTDCGVASVEEVRSLAEAGIETIVLDHHQPQGALPPALAVVDPKREGSAYPFADLAGVGVAFLFLMAIRHRMRERGYFSDSFPEPPLRKYLELVALGTVADVMPLRDQNRILVSHGLAELQSTQSPGLASLRMTSGLGEEEISAGRISFVLAPRINAVGRLGVPEKGLRLLTSEKMQECLEMAGELERYNQERQQVEEEILRQALEQVAGVDWSTTFALTLDGREWHSGVVGIVASRLVEAYNRPTILLCHEGEMARGSARGIDGFDLLAALEETADCLLAYGGHRAAAGVKVALARLPEFRRRFENACRRQLAERELLPSHTYDAEIALDALTAKLGQEVAQMLPFGMGNPEPLFVSRGLRVSRLTVLKGKHFKGDFVDRNGAAAGAICFNSLPPPGAENSAWDLLYAPQWEEWQGRRRLQLKIKDYRVL